MDIIFDKHEPLKRSKTDEFLKKLAIDLENGIIFTDRHLQNNSADIMIVFMPIMFMFGSQKKTEKDRKSKIYNIFLVNAKEEYFKSVNKTEEETITDYWNSIGLIYEYLDKQSPRAVNGKPTFMSCNFLSIEDTELLFKYYEEYKVIKAKMMGEFGI